MKERPILFSTEMVRAILDGRKTMTRRVVKPQPEWKERDGLSCAGWSWKTVGASLSSFMNESLSEAMSTICPYGTVGDILWVRETFCIGAIDEEDSSDGYKGELFISQAHGDDNVIYKEYALSNNIGMDEVIWKPSIFMPRSASRISLRITNIRVERLNDITEEDAKREGVSLHKSIDPNRQDLTHKWRFAFCLLWESINGKGSWDQNPWVWVIEFEAIK